MISEKAVRQGSLFCLKRNNSPKNEFKFKFQNHKSIYLFAVKILSIFTPLI